MTAKPFYGQGPSPAALDPIDAVVAGLDDADVSVVAHLPCGQARGLFARLDDAFDTLHVTREEEAVGVLAGTAMAGTRCALVMQSSGLGNAMNVLTTLTESYELPLPLIVSHRGHAQDWNPAQRPQGRRTPYWLKSLEAAPREPPPAEVRPAVRDAVDAAFEQQRITSVLLGPDVFEGGDDP